MNKRQVLERFIAGQYPQIHCKKCENTFLTNVFDFDATHVLLEKRSLGLEYYCGAIHKHDLTKVPDIERVGVLDEDDNIIQKPAHAEIYSGEETDFRFIYVMEKLSHLDEGDAAYFDRCVSDLDWKSEAERIKIIEGVTRRYNTELAQDIARLYDFYKVYEHFMAWDLHGDNLMKRVGTDEIVILDPYTRKA